MISRSTSALRVLGSHNVKQSMELAYENPELVLLPKHHALYEHTVMEEATVTAHHQSTTYDLQGPTAL